MIQQPAEGVGLDVNLVSISVASSYKSIFKRQLLKHSDQDVGPGGLDLNQTVGLEHLQATTRHCLTHTQRGITNNPLSRRLAWWIYNESHMFV